jgi:hypothetical protein
MPGSRLPGRRVRKVGSGTPTACRASLSYMMTDQQNSGSQTSDHSRKKRNKAKKVCSPAALGWGIHNTPREATVLQGVRAKQTRSAPHRPGKALAAGPAGGAHRAKQSQFASDRPAEPLVARAPRAAAGDKRVKQSQFAQSDVRGQVLCRKRVMTNWACPWPGKNKANLRPSGGREGSGIRHCMSSTPR